MKKTVYLLAIMMLAAACQNGNTRQVEDTTNPTEKRCGVSFLCESDTTIFVGVVDMENEMPADLFRGSYDDKLLDSLLPTGSTPSAINVFLVDAIKSSEYQEIDREYGILFDAGIGADKGGQMKENMDKEGMKPSKIDAILLTHLHADHIGGLLLNGKAAFPNATIYLSQEEYDAWSDRGPFAGRNSLWKEVQKAYAGHINTFHDGEKLCDGIVEAILAPGHTPGHTVYKVDGGTCYVVGDLLHAQDLQIDHPDFCASYDYNPTMAVQSRKKILNQLSNGNSYMAAAHCHDHFINLRDRAEGR